MYTPFVNAQESIRLDSIIIQGGRLPSSLFSEGKQISILTQQDIRAIPASSLDELLAYVTGVFVYSLGVNPFNQPGVEDYKKAMYRLLGK